MKGAAFAEDSVVKLVEVEVNEFPASIEVSRVATDRNWYTETVLAASNEDTEKAVKEGMEEDIEEDVDEIKTVERTEDDADVVIVSTALLRNEAGIVALEEIILLVTNDVEVSDDKYTAAVDKDRSDDAVVIIIRITVKTLNVEAEIIVVDISTINYIEVDASEVTPVGARDKEADIELDIKEDVPVPLLIAFPIKVFISRPGLIINIMPF
jgi:hypothetical protein